MAGLDAQLVQDHAGGLAADARERLHGGALERDLAAVLLQQDAGERDHVPGLGVEQADGLDEGSEALHAERGHAGGVGRDLEQRTGGLVDRDVGGLGGEDDGDQQGEGVDIVQLGLGRGVDGLETAEDLGRAGGLAGAAAGGGLAAEGLRHRAAWRRAGRARIWGVVSTAGLYMDATITPNRSLSGGGSSCCWPD
jgi:hypothetical protein